MKVGVTGTRNGISSHAISTAVLVIASLTNVEELHHGDCVGADASMHYLALAMGIQPIIHPPNNGRFRAWCVFPYGVPNIVAACKSYGERNEHIVYCSDVLIAFPKEYVEPPNPTGGTWQTIGFAREKGMPIAVIWPNGFVTYERWDEQ